jgi:hypothetical protein
MERDEAVDGGGVVESAHFGEHRAAWRVDDLHILRKHAVRARP